MTVEFVSAREACEKVLDITGTALLAGDFDSFAAVFTMPTKVETFEGARVIESREELREAFDGVCHHYRSVGATDLVRHIVAAEFIDDDLIRATHECRVLAKTELTQAPFAVHSTYVREDGRWKVCESIYIVDDAPMYIRALTHGDARRLGPVE